MKLRMKYIDVSLGVENDAYRKDQKRYGLKGEGEEKAGGLRLTRMYAHDANNSKLLLVNLAYRSWHNSNRTFVNFLIYILGLKMIKAFFSIFCIIITFSA